MKKFSSLTTENRLPANTVSSSCPKVKFYSWNYARDYNIWICSISEMMKWKGLKVRISISRSFSCQYEAAVWRAFLRLISTCILFVGCSSSGEIYAPSQMSLSSPVYANAFEIWGHPGHIRHSTSPVTFRIQCETRYGWEVFFARPNLYCHR